MYKTVGVILIFSRFLGNIKEAFDKNSNLTNLLLDDFFKAAITDCQVRCGKIGKHTIKKSI